MENSPTNSHGTPKRGPQKEISLKMVGVKVRVKLRSGTSL